MTRDPTDAGQAPSSSRWRRVWRPLMTPATLALAGLLVACVTMGLVIVVISTAKSDLSGQLNAAQRERATLNDRVGHLVDQNALMSRDLVRLGGEVEALRAQLQAAGITPVEVVVTPDGRPTVTPGSTTTTTRPRTTSQTSPPTSKSPPTTRPSTPTTARPCRVTIPGRCVVP